MSAKIMQAISKVKYLVDNNLMTEEQALFITASRYAVDHKALIDAYFEQYVIL